jgi:hypothetical protein
LLPARLEGNAVEVSTERSASAAAGPRGGPAVNRAAEPVRNGRAPKRPPPAGNGSDRVRPVLLFRWACTPASASWPRRPWRLLFPRLPGQPAAPLGQLPGAQIENLFASLLARLSSELLRLTGRLFSALASALTVAVLTTYFMAGRPRLRRGAVLLYPREHRGVHRRRPTAFAALGGPFAVPLAFVVAVTDLIPVIGATPGAVICVLVPLLATSVWPVTVLVAVFSCSTSSWRTT